VNTVDHMGENAVVQARFILRALTGVTMKLQP